jgi:molecular chaperone HscB
VAAAPASQPEHASARQCAYCERPLAGAVAPHVCESCRRIQPLGGVEDYFEALGVPRAFAQDGARLQSRFYELSRALHPDRFGGASAADRAASLDRMSLVNQAYATLKDPERLRDYLLEREGVKAAKGQLPMELAESWFELQDLLIEDRESALARLKGFEESVARFARAENEAVAALERDYDRSQDRGVLGEIARKIQSLNYLQSLERDIARLKGR